MDKVPGTDNVPETVICNFALAMDLSSVPEDVVTRAKWLMLDQIGVELACADLPWVRRLHNYLSDVSAPGECTVVGRSERFAPESAALLNGIAGHGFEADDYVTVAPAHPSCAVVPAVLAVGESAESSGNDVLAAYLCGVEFVVRVAQATTPAMLYERGFHQTGTLGVFGSALASGMLLSMAADTLAHTVGTAASHASGTTEFTQSGGDVKRLRLSGAEWFYRADEVHHRPPRFPACLHAIESAVADD